MRILILLLFLPFSAFSQHLEILSDNHPAYSNMYQFSSIIYYNGNLFLPAEKCDSLIQITPEGKYIKGYLLRNNPVQIEGAALYKDYIFLVNETSDAKKRIYIHNLRNMQLVNTIELPEFSIGDDSMGLEGLAINQEKNVCYVLREKNEEGKSVIKQYKLSQSDGKFKLSYQNGSDIIIPHTDNLPGVENKRYTDLVCNNDSVFILGSYYFGNRDDRNQYFIDMIPVINANGIIESAPDQPSINYSFIDLSRQMRLYNRQQNGHFYNTSLEGMTIANGSFFLVTDNAQSLNNNCSSQSAGRDKTLLLKFRKP